MKKYDKISSYFKENIKILIPFSIAALFFDGLMCFIPQIEGMTINSLKNNDYDSLIRYALIFLGLVLFVQINRFIKRFLVRVFGNKMTLRMREVSFSNLLDYELSYFKNNTGDILNRNLSDIYDTTEGIRKMTTEVFDTIVLLLGYLIMMFIMDYQITLFALIFIGLSILIAQGIKRKVYRLNKEYKEYLSINREITLTNINNELNYRGMGITSFYHQEYNKSLKTLRKKNTKAMIFQNGFEPFYTGVALIGVLFIAYFGGIKVIDNIYEIGTLSAYITTFLLVAKKSARIGKIFNAYQGFKISWARCKPYLENNNKKEIDIHLDNAKLELTNFSYDYGNFKLPDINIMAQEGEIIGICGRIHTGKSTIIKALTGLYDYQGEAKLGGYDIKDYIFSNQEFISYCSANNALFSDTLEENIKLGREGNINRAIGISQLDANELGGLEAFLSHSVINVSGGQQKRIQMARALYPESKLILLDDPFQSVDKIMALKMIKELKKCSKSIIILVSNNPLILKETNKIIYLEDEAIVDTYQNLLNRIEFSTLMGVMI